MQPRSTLLLLALVAAAGFALWHFELRDGAKPDDARTEVFAGLEAAQIAWVEIDQPDGTKARLEKRGEAWRITQPVDAPADRFAADAVASALADLASETVFDPAAEDAAQRPEPPESYGLTREPRVRFGAGEKTLALRLGDPTPVSGNTYVAAEGDPRVFVVPDWQTNALAKPLAELREARLFDFDREKLTKIVLARPEGGATLEKQDGAWRLTAPLADAADDVAVQSLISDLAGLRADAFLDAPPPDAELGFDAPAARVALAAEGGATYSLLVGAPRGEDRRAARSGAGGVVEIAATFLERLPKDAAALRDKTLASFVSSEAQSFRLELADGAGAPLVVTGTSGDEGWKTEPAMEDGAASALMAEVASLTGRAIAAESLGPAERRAFGLEPPRARIVVRGAGAGEAAPLLADLRFGVLREGEGLAAQRADREIVYWVDASRADALPTDAARFREKFAVKAKPAADAKPATDAAPPAQKP